MIQIILGMLLMFASIVFITEGIKEQCDIKNYILKTDVRDAFKGVDLSKQIFMTSGITMKDTKGNDTFYASKDIDGAINKLNEKLSR